MAQKAIREFDAKSIWYTYLKKQYSGILITNENEYGTIENKLENIGGTEGKWVVKPDQLFGKRGKHGLLGVNLTSQEVRSWIDNHRKQQQEINGVSGLLDTFLIEPFIPHEKERYIAIKTERMNDVIYFSHKGGIDIEENWESIIELKISVLKDIQREIIVETFGDLPQEIISFIEDFFVFFRNNGFSYLEVNPFVLRQNEIICLDMVAKVDTAEARKQKQSWKNISRIKPFGSSTHPLEKKIEEMDAETGASLKFSTLNPKGSITLLLGGGGASIVTIDKLANLGLLEQTVNYGELSGNPNYRHNKEYTQGLIDMMCENNHKKQWLCLIGGIANFTRIDVLSKAFIDALSDRIEDIKKANIHILVRRGGVNDQKGLSLIESFCKKHTIPCSIADGDTYITTAIEALQS